MDLLKKVELKMADVFKDVPSLPLSTQKLLAGWLQWAAPIVGIVQLVVAWGLFAWGRNADRVIQTINNYSNAFGVETSAERLGLFYWLSLIFLVIQAVLLLWAYSGLKSGLKKGWDLVFLAALVNVVYGVFSAFTSRGGFESLFFSLIGSAVGLYLLFQVRNQYTVKVAAAKAKSA
ncbi:hypothetical protein EB118_11005 [bacterium]|nr:hypothetical protein [bacterium]NBX97971.1 hypothetical protein [bacterium]NDC94421.1 hypothetical protein [bacterium]NDD83547.1 hypothetical protein [bacterium]NDG30584.1 hypothetical protein [bacterium]